MKTRILFIICLVSSISLSAQDKMYIHKSDKITLGVLLSGTDSIYFSGDGTLVYFRLGDTVAQYPITGIDSITFGDNSNTILVTYYDSWVSVINPLAFEGVSVTVEGSDVTVNSVTETQDINFKLTGATNDGMFKIYAAAQYNLILNGVDLTNLDGPAVNVQSKKQTSVILEEGTVNTLTDGLNYLESPLEEDQKGAFFSEGKLVFSGAGSLIINGNGSEQHGLCSDKTIEVTGGNIMVTKATKDGIHAKDGLLISDGTINVIASGDGIDGDEGDLEISGGSITTNNIEDDVKGISCDGDLVISGGMVNITVTGDQSKGIKGDLSITLSGGSVTINTSGDAVLESSGSGYDPSYCTAIKSDEDINITGAEITITCSGIAGKGISSDANINMTGGSIQVTSTGNGATYTNSSGVLDAYVSTCFSTDGNLNIVGGSVTTSSSGSGGKGFSSDGSLNIGSAVSSPTIRVTTTGTKIYISGWGEDAQYAEAKAIKSDSAILISKGNITISSADDGIKSEASIEINDATISITKSIEGLEAPFITVNSGNLHINASDDCINTTFGNGGEQDDGSLLTINGGYIAVNTTGGDGIDANGDILFTGGTTIVHGPPSAPEVGMDYNGTCNMNGGLLVISGPNSSNMIQAPSNTSDQYCLKAISNQSLSSSTLFHLQDASGNNILTFQPSRKYNHIVFSSSGLQNGANYSIYTGGTCTGTTNDGLYTGGTYSGGTLKKTFTISSKITSVNF